MMGIGALRERGGDRDQESSRIVVTFKTVRDNVFSAADLSDAVTVKQYGRRWVLDLGRPFDLEVERQVFTGLFGSVQSVEIDHFVTLQQMEITQILVNDTLFVTEINSTDSNIDGAYINQGGQTPLWNLMDSEPYSIHVEGVWQFTNSTPDVVVAILDTGMAQPAKDQFLNLLSGYDFISDDWLSVDGDGRDPDSTDPGDWADMCPVPSWHGTKVASILAARHDNVWGMKGVAQNCSVLPVRVIGICKMGYATDVADAIVWAAGGTIDGIQSNPNPAKIISLSLAGQGACPSYLQSAVSQAVSLGVSVIVAAGNNKQNASGYFPANCAGVVAVAASSREGKLAEYSNWGVLIAAPGGESTNAIMTLGVNALETDLEVAYGIGSSFATPHAAGVASLYLGLPRHLQMFDLTQGDTYILSFAIKGKCTQQQCGKGILSANKLIQPVFTSNQSFIETVSNWNGTAMLTGAVAVNPPNYNLPGYVTNQDDSLYTWSNGNPPGGYFFYQCGTGKFACRVSLYYTSGMYMKGFAYRCCDASMAVTHISGCIGPCDYWDYYQHVDGYFNRFRVALYSFYVTDYAGTSIGMNSYDVNGFLSTGTCTGGYVINGFYGWYGTGLDEVYVLCRPMYVLCPKGYYSLGPSINSGGGALPCPAGAYNSETGRSTCSACSVNTYGPSQSISCTACPAGTFSNPGSSICLPVMSTCSAGYAINPSYTVKSNPGYSYYSHCQQGSYICGYNHQNIYAYYFYCCALGGAQVGYWKIKTPSFDGGGYEALYVATSTANPPSPFSAYTTFNVLQYGLSRLISSWYGATVYSNGVNSYTIGDGGGSANSGNSDSTCPTGTVATGIVGIWGANMDQKELVCNALCLGCIALSTYTATAGQASCATCTVCTAGSRVSTACTPTSNTLCAGCNAGTYSASGASICTQCPAGTYSASGASICTQCPTGRYSATAGASLSSTCQACTVGTYFGTTGASVCTQCPTGQYSGTTGASVCTQCPAGHFSGTAGNSVCPQCPVGQYFGTPGATVCTQCPVGQFAGAIGATVCTQCPVGQFSGVVEATVCTQCIAGKYVGIAGATVCTQCIAGQYSGTAGASVCTQCPTGKYSSATGASLSSDCQVCTPGTYSATTGASLASVCVACTAGTYSASGASLCANCAPGKTSQSAAATCTDCQAGKYSISTTVCSDCSSGKYSATVGASSSMVCALCLAGTYSGAGASACTPCGPNTFSLGGVSQCTACSQDACLSTQITVACTSTSDKTCSTCNAALIPPNADFTSRSDPTCPWTCNTGYYRNTATTLLANMCLQCSISSIGCGVGQYRPMCSEGATSSAACQTCTNAPANSAYTSPSVTPGSSECQYSCNTPLYTEQIQSGFCCLICGNGYYNSGCTKTSSGTCGTCSNS